jgi:ribosomal protein S18 acetylase RimI-like enzyme
MTPVIAQAELRDAPAILELQRLCFRSEAELNHDFNIPPLTQTLAELDRQFVTHRILKISVDGEIVGSVRAIMAGDTCKIGRLIVHPKFQRQGLGSQLMRRIESEFPWAARFEIFTGSRSTGNLRLYEHLGYREARREAASGKLTIVFLQKP